jgi:pimeloyl-ACP methyl ester carboxylesterase
MIDPALPPRATRLILFPGLGADERLFEPQRRGLPRVRIEVPRWIEPLSIDESIESYSKRLAATIEPAVAGERLFLGGVSLGAIVALEAARHLPGTRAVFMMGGCRDTRAVAPFFRFACSLTRWVPAAGLKLILYGSPAALVLFESLSWRNMRLYAHMINDSSPTQVRWAAGAMPAYRSAGDPPGVRVRLIHGQRDLIIPPKNVHPDYVIPHGRHLVSLTRPAEVNRILIAEMAYDPHMPENEEREFVEVVIVLDPLDDEQTKHVVDELRSRGLQVESVDNDTSVVEGTVDAAQLAALESAPSVQYVRKEFTYIAESPRKPDGGSAAE